MSKWNHSICISCWNKREPEREPVTLKPEIREVEICCFCNQPHNDGIFVRENWAFTKCRGETGYHKEKEANEAITNALDSIA